MVITEMTPYDAAVLLAVDADNGWIEIQRLNAVTPESWWQELVDEFVCLIAEDN